MPTITLVNKDAPKDLPNSNSPESKAQSARERAMALVMGKAPNVQDQNAVSAEEAAALSAGQNDIIVPQDETANTQEPADGTQEATTPATPPAEDPLQKQYAALARKEKAMRAKAIAQEQSLKAREAALAAKEAEFSSNNNTIDTSKYISIEELKRNAFGKLQDLGVSYDDLSQQAMAAQSPELQAVRQLKEELQAELRKVREEQDRSKKSFEEQQTQQYTQAINQIRNDVKSLVKTDPSFETIKATGSVEDVVELIESVFKDEGTILTVEEAAKLVEDQLVEEVLKVASKSKKLKDRLTPAQQAVKDLKQQSSNAAQQQPAQQMKTLTNSVGTTRKLTTREKAILAMRGELKE